MLMNLGVEVRSSEMSNTEYEELKRVCRMRGVPEPPYANAVEFTEAQDDDMLALAEAFRAVVLHQRAPSK